MDPWSLGRCVVVPILWRHQILEVSVIYLHRQWNQGLLNFQTGARRGGPASVHTYFCQLRNQLKQPHPQHKLSVTQELIRHKQRCYHSRLDGVVYAKDVLSERVLSIMRLSMKGTFWNVLMEEREREGRRLRWQLGALGHSRFMLKALLPTPFQAGLSGCNVLCG